MTQNQLISIIAKLEGKESQVAIGNIREIVKILQALLGENSHEFLPDEFTNMDVLRVLIKGRKG